MVSIEVKSGPTYVKQSIVYKRQLAVNKWHKVRPFPNGFYWKKSDLAYVKQSKQTDADRRSFKHAHNARQLSTNKWHKVRPLQNGFCWSQKVFKLRETEYKHQ